MKISRFREFNEELGFKDYLIGALLSLGLTAADAQKIDTPNKEAIVDTLFKYNQNPKGFNHLRKELGKQITNTDLLLDLITIQPDHTVVVKPKFIPGLELVTNPEQKRFTAGYTFKF